MKPTHLTVIIGNYAAYQGVGIGPQFRRVTVELTPEQKEKLRYSVDCEEIHQVIMETILADKAREGGK